MENVAWPLIAGFAALMIGMTIMVSVETLTYPDKIRAKAEASIMTESCS